MSQRRKLFLTGVGAVTAFFLFYWLLYLPVWNPFNDAEDGPRYVNSKLGFSIAVPEGAKSTEGVTADDSGRELAMISLNGVIADPAFSEAYILLTRTNDPRYVTTCEGSREHERPTGDVDIGGVTFKSFIHIGHLEGNVMELKTFRTIRNGACVALVEALIWNGQVSYSATTQRLYNDIWGTLDSMRDTFRFM